MNQVYFPIITEAEQKYPFYVKSIGIQRNQEDIKRPKGHPDFHWIHVTKGAGRVSINGEETVVSENMGFFIHPGIKHEYSGIEKPWETHWMTFSGYGVDQLLGQIGLSKSGSFYVVKEHILEEYFSNVLNAVGGSKPINDIQTSIYLYEFLMNCKTCISENQKPSYDRVNQLSPVISYMKERYSENLSLDEMAKVIHVTPHHLCRLFMELLHMRPFEYLTKIRIKKAKELMTNAISPSTKDIAKQVGYSDTSYFCAVFKKYEGVTPGAFKKSK